MIRTVLLDFDGTLVHTAPGILAGFRKTLAAAGIAPVEAVDERVIGPPLMATLQRLTGLGPGEALDRLAATFRATYDADGVLDCEPYPGLLEVLDAVRAEGRAAIVVTNKRQAPARLIADRLGFSPRLDALYSLDSLTPPAPRKQALVAHILAAHGAEAATTVLVGDSSEDAHAAAGNGVAFIAARYGYGDPGDGTVPAVATLERLADLPAALRRLD